jgi:hypothetical protein
MAQLCPRESHSRAAARHLVTRTSTTRSGWLSATRGCRRVVASRALEDPFSFPLARALEDDMRQTMSRQLQVHSNAQDSRLWKLYVAGVDCSPVQLLEEMNRDMFTDSRLLPDIESSSRLWHGTLLPLSFMCLVCDQGEDVTEAALCVEFKSSGIPGSGFSYFSEQHAQNYHSMHSVTIWSSSGHMHHPVQQAGPSWLVVAAATALLTYVGMGAAFWANYSKTRCAQRASDGEYDEARLAP